MEKFFKLLTILFFTVYISHGQIAISNDLLGGTPLAGQSYTDVKGSPYLSEDFQKGDVILVSGRKYENMDIKYDAFLKKIVFLDSKDGESKYFDAPVGSFSFKSASNQQYFFRNPDGNFFELLSSGKISLWKSVSKSMVDDRPYGSTKAQKIINTNIFYYAGDMGSLKKLKNDKKSILEMFPGKSVEVEGFIKNKGLNPKNEEELVKIFAYYNNL